MGICRSRPQDSLIEEGEFAIKRFMTLNDDFATGRLRLQRGIEN